MQHPQRSSITEIPQNMNYVVDALNSHMGGSDIILPAG